MKRKLITLFVAFLAVVGFQAKAADPVRVVIHTGDSIDERSNYAWGPAALPNHLTFDGTNIKWVVKGPDIQNVNDRFYIANPIANVITISTKASNGTLLTAKDANGTVYNQFVVFTSDAANTTIYPASADNIKAGTINGYLAIQAGVTVPTNDDLLIVVHNDAGIVSVMPYKDYIVNVNTTDFSTKAGKTKVYPLYIETNTFGGRWAVPSDFSCMFNKFSTADKYGNILPGGGLDSLFTIKQVDYVAEADPANQNINNLVTDYKDRTGKGNNGGGVKYTGPDGDDTATADNNYGTMNGNDTIPLFVLTSPNSCKVLSVARSNDLKTQSQQAGGYANKLEFREYGQYYALGEKSKIYDDLQMAKTDDDYMRYTSLQKFAIWITEDGDYILYPAASYFWEYGDNKDTQDNVLPNSVLIYNNRDVNYVPSVLDPQGQPDWGWGVQIGWWNGHLTSYPNLPDGYLGTVPNKIQTGLGALASDYEARAFSWICGGDDKDLSGRFYFLQVYPDTTGNAAATGFSAAFGKNGYQTKNIDYVLSTQVSRGDKYLVSVVKEDNRSTTPDAEYWRFPYDSVNMAAHWQVVKDAKANAYRFVNMLGDTLKFAATDIPTAGTTNFGATLAGGYLPVNGLIPGDNAGSGSKYFGRPDLPNSNTAVGNWFPVNPNSNPAVAGSDVYSLWKINKFPNSDAFIIELCDSTGNNLNVGLAFDTWSNSNLSPLSANKTDKYYQQQIGLDLPAADDNLKSYDRSTPFQSCGGLKMAMKSIDYVPMYGGFYPGDKYEAGQGTYNTNDEEWPFQKQDSLTAYTFLEGNFSIVEADKVNNDLKLGYATVSLNDAANTPVNAARLTVTEKTVEFIPFIEGTDANGKIVKQRNDTIRTALGLPTDPTKPGYWNDLSLLFGENYKWYLVRNAEGQYLSFDLVNMTAKTNREKVGLVFTNILANAIPVRLYQPLVGDKKNNNFLIQFYMPHNTFTWHSATAKDYLKPLTIDGNLSNFPNIESTNLGDKWIGLPAGSRDEVCFATLSNESNYLFATRAYTGLTSGTRFTFLPPNAPDTCGCVNAFIPPSWLAEKHLLNLPLENHVWDNVTNDFTTAWIATGDKYSTGNYAIIKNTSADDATTLTHTYVATIKGGSVTLPGKLANGNATTISGFAPDLDVALYYVQNDAGQYLTVVKECDMSDPRATLTDVNGVKLAWMNKNAFTATTNDSRTLQLFAISGCQKDTVDNVFGQFIYLPLASYKWDYANNQVANNSALSFNLSLGKKESEENVYCTPGNDLTNCWRVSQYSSVSSDVKHLVVFNSNTGTVGGNLVPVPFKVWKKAIEKPNCDYDSYIVQDNANKKYYTYNDTISLAGSNTLFAHWDINFDSITDMATFVPEVKTVYNDTVGVGKAIDQTFLDGNYYFKKVKDMQYIIIDVSKYDVAKDVYDAKLTTVNLQCTEHTMPFFNLATDGHFSLPTGLAILETPFLDRNMSGLSNKQDWTPIMRGKELIGYQTTVDKNIGEDAAKTVYLNAYKENERKLTDNHIIPYYSFSIIGPDGNPYFLKVDKASDRPGQVGEDSVYWSKLNPDQQQILLDPVTYPDSFPTYKFCLPYAVDSNGVPIKTLTYGEEDCSPVYMQTLDTAKLDLPYIIITGANTGLVTTKRIDKTINKAGGDNKTLDWNIYTMDYRYIDQTQVTAWIFGGQMPIGDVWVKVQDAVASGSTEGVVTNQGLGLGGVTFIDQSKESPVNYGIMTGVNDAPNLKLEFEGDTLIGTFAMSNIWYYRINLDGKYLTDAYGKDPKKDSTYFYTFNDNTYPYGFFAEKIAPHATYSVTADSAFVQTFGFEYVNTADTIQSFWIVSNANYTKKPAEVEKYRYLAEVNNQLVFVDDNSYALVFQWGHIDGGKYTDLQIVGKGGIFGVEGGIKFLNTTGKVDVYSIDGRLIKSAVLTGGEQTLAAPRGIAVVKAGTQVVKVVIR